MIVSRGWKSLAGCFALTLMATLSGCTATVEEPPHEHAAPEHAPRNLADLGAKIRERIERLESGEDAEAVAELTDLIGWAAEIAADTEIGEERWNPIWDLSESLRLSIIDAPDQWDDRRKADAIQLCQLVEEGWESMAPADRVDRYLNEHDHDDGHGHHDDHSRGDDHGHDEDDHGHSEHPPVASASGNALTPIALDATDV